MKAKECMHEFLEAGLLRIWDIRQELSCTKVVLNESLCLQCLQREVFRILQFIMLNLSGAPNISLSLSFSFSFSLSLSLSLSLSFSNSLCMRECSSNCAMLKRDLHPWPLQSMGLLLLMSQKNKLLVCPLSGGGGSIIRKQLEIKIQSQSMKRQLDFNSTGCIHVAHEFICWLYKFCKCLPKHIELRPYKEHARHRMQAQISQHRPSHCWVTSVRPKLLHKLKICPLSFVAPEDFENHLTVSSSQVTYIVSKFRSPLRDPPDIWLSKLFCRILVTT